MERATIWSSLDPFTVLTMLSLALVGGQWGVISYSLDDFAANVGRDSTAISMIFVAYLVGSVPGSIVGPLYDAFPSRVISFHIAILVCLAITTGVLAYYTTYPSLVVGFGLAGASATSMLSSVPILTIWHHLEDSGPLLSLNWCALALGGTLVPTGMYFLNGCSLETQIVGAFCLPCILCAVCFSFFTESATPNSELAATPGKGLRTPLLAQHSSHTSTALEQLLLGLTGLCLTAGQSTYNTLLETYAQDFLGWSSSEASRALIAFFGAFATGSIGSAIMLDKKVQPVTLLTWFSLVLVVSTSAPLLSLSLSGLFWASTMLTGFAYGFLFGPVLEATHEWYGGSGAALLPLSSGMNIGGALGPFVTDTCMGYTDVAFLYITTAFSVALFCAILLAHLLHTAVNASP